MRRGWGGGGHADPCALWPRPAVEVSWTASSVHPSALQDGSLQCPSCKTIYGEKTGTQPWGKMEVFRFQASLPGHEDCGTILIVYNIPHGIQVRAGSPPDLAGSPFLSTPFLLTVSSVSPSSMGSGWPRLGRCWGLGDGRERRWPWAF